MRDDRRALLHKMQHAGARLFGRLFIEMLMNLLPRPNSNQNPFNCSIIPDKLADVVSPSGEDYQRRKGRGVVTQSNLQFLGYGENASRLVSCPYLSDLSREAS